jgi:hypothetical protein
MLAMFAMTSATLFAFVVACLVVSARLRTRRGAALFSVAVFLFLALGVPFIDVAYKCLRQPTSEACVWGKSLWAITVAIGAVVGAVIGGGAYLMALGFQRRRRLASETAGNALR